MSDPREIQLAGEAAIANKIATSGLELGAPRFAFDGKAGRVTATFPKAPKGSPVQSVSWSVDPAARDFHAVRVHRAE